MTSSFNEVNSSVTACELPFAGGWIPYQAAAPGVGLLRHAQLRHTTEGVLAQTVAQPTRQVLQVSSTLAWQGPHYTVQYFPGPKAQRSILLCSK